MEKGTKHEVLVCVDEGAYSETVLPAVAKLASNGEIETVLIRVRDPESLAQLSRDRMPSLARGIADASPPGIPAPAADLTGEPVPGPAGHINTSDKVFEQRAYDDDRLLAQATAETRHDLASLAKRHGLVVQGIVAFDERPADAILRHAEAENVDVIAMTTHARGAFGEVLHGSTAKDVLARSPVPVLLVHPQEG